MNPRLDITSGRRFGCTMCGNCCVEDGYVHLSAFEVRRIADYLGLAPSIFKGRYLVDEDPDTLAASIPVKDGKGCPLLTPDRQCSVHPVKPSQCSTWPFWPEMIGEAAEWQRCKSYCPGLDAKDGRLYSESEIRGLVTLGGRTDESG